MNKSLNPKNGEPFLTTFLKFPVRTKPFTLGLATRPSCVSSKGLHPPPNVIMVQLPQATRTLLESLGT